MPLFMPIGFAPEVIANNPYLIIYRAKIIAVVVPSPAAALTLNATCMHMKQHNTTI